jgi:hypothetical protein
MPHAESISRSHDGDATTNITSPRSNPPNFSEYPPGRHLRADGADQRVRPVLVRRGQSPGRLKNVGRVTRSRARWRPAGIGRASRRRILRTRLPDLRLRGLRGRERNSPLALLPILRIRQIVRLIKPRIRPAVVGQELHGFVVLHAAFEEHVEHVAFAVVDQGAVGAAGGGKDVTVEEDVAFEDRLFAGFDQDIAFPGSEVAVVIERGELGAVTPLAAGDFVAEELQERPLVAGEPPGGPACPGDTLLLGAAVQVQVVLALGLGKFVFDPRPADPMAALNFASVDWAGRGREHSHLEGHAEGDGGVALLDAAAESPHDGAGHGKSARSAGLELLAFPGIEGGDELGVVVDPPADASQADAGRLGSLAHADAGGQLLEHPLLSRGELAGQGECLGRIVDRIG